MIACLVSIVKYTINDMSKVVYNGSQDTAVKVKRRL